MKHSIVGMLSMAALTVMALANPAAAWPDRPITLIVPWSAGGGTDATARQIAYQLEAKLDVPVNVVNRTGGGGVVGHTAIANATPDGYTIGVVTFEITTFHWQGLTDLSYQDFTPLAQYNFDPAGLQVAADSPFETAAGLIEAIRDQPKRYLASTAGGHGTGWQLAFAGLLERLDIDVGDVRWVPGEGAAPALQEMAAEAIDIVPCSLPEAAGLLEAQRVRSLLVMADERIAAFPDIPTAKEALGVEWTGGSWRGIVGPKGMPQEAVDALVPALQEVYESSEFQEFMTQRGFGVMWRHPEAFEAFMAEADANTGRLLASLDRVK